MILYDLEADGLDVRPDMRVWCAVTIDLTTDEVVRYRSHELEAFYAAVRGKPRAAFNGFAYDERVLASKDPDYRAGGAVDVRVLCKAAWPDAPKVEVHYPDKVRHERHSLAAWGVRVGAEKALELQPTDWTRWDPAMLDYCEQDTRTLREVWRWLQQHAPGIANNPLARGLESRFAQILERRNRIGVQLDVPYLEKLLIELEAEQAGLYDKLTRGVPPFERQTSKRAYWTGPYGHRYPTKGRAPRAERGLLKPGPFEVEKVEFNPNSANHIVDYLTKKYEWKPVEFTDAGNPLTEARVLRGLPWPEASEFANYREVSKAVAYLHSHSGQGYLDVVSPDGRLRSTIDHNGTVTHRCSHYTPNVGNIWRRGERGRQIRQGFVSKPGWQLLGWDIARLELVGLGCLLQPYDDGRFLELVQNEGETYSDHDLHWLTATALGLVDWWLPSLLRSGVAESEAKKLVRDTAKTMVYAWLYGCGDATLGSHVPLPPKDACLSIARKEFRKYRAHQRAYVERFRKKGRTVEAPWYWGCYGLRGEVFRQRLEKGIPGVANLIAHLKQEAMRGYLTAVDGRPVRIRKDNAALNTKNQSWGAIVVKAITVFFVAEAERRGSLRGRDWDLVLHTHDEAQSEVDPDHVPTLETSFFVALRRAERLLRLPVHLNGEVKVGTSWSETH
jgi:DNA polymerase I-like protein with 3'-5' exonuclease and polymerase domains